MSDERLLAEVGGRLARLRLEKNLTQSELARQAGVGERTVQRLEGGAVATQLSGFFRVCRVLGILERMELILPEPGPSPMARLKLEGKRRRRASGPAVAGKKPGPWKWGDES